MVHGLLQAGSESSPHTKRFTLTLTGEGAADIMGMGDKVLGVMSGRLELHGEARRGWTQLGATAAAGATDLMLLRSRSVARRGPHRGGVERTSTRSRPRRR